LSAQLDPRSFREKKIILSQMTLQQPIVTWHKTKKIPTLAQEQNSSESPAAQPPPMDDPRASKLLIKSLRVKNGRFHFTDESNGQVLSFQLDNLQMTIEDLAFPIASMATTFTLKGVLIKENAPLSGSLVQSSGWIDLAQKDLDGSLLISQVDGKSGLSAHAIAKNNDLNVEGKIKAQNLFQPVDKPLETTVNNIVLNTLSNMGIEIGANFSFNTKLDDFRIEQISFSGSVSTHSVPAAPEPSGSTLSAVEGSAHSVPTAGSMNPVAE
jgi:uncharacterized protein involved in outer membrane biogenesis